MNSTVCLRRQWIFYSLFTTNLMEELQMNEQITDQQLNAAGHLTIGGCDAVDLAHQFGTP